jgi:hypothetical protein
MTEPAGTFGPPVELVTTHAASDKTLGLPIFSTLFQAQRLKYLGYQYNPSQSRLLLFCNIALQLGRSGSPDVLL